MPLTNRHVAAKRLFDSGSVHINLEKGFALKIHDRFPNAPLSPIFLSLRPEGVKNGHLSDTDIKMIGVAMVEKMRDEGLVYERTIVGIPNAGDPITDAIMGALTPQEASLLTRRHMIKVEADGKRKITGFSEEVTPREISDLVAIDDLMSNADTKLEADAEITAAGGSLEDLVIFLNRSKDGIARLAKSDICVHAVWEFDDLINFYVTQGNISAEAARLILAYPYTLQGYIDAQ